MKKHSDDSQGDNAGINNFIRLWHLTMIILCLASGLTGMQSVDYRNNEYAKFIVIAVDETEAHRHKSGQIGFITHGCLGTMLFFSLCIYFGYGIHQSRFLRCFPLTQKRLRQTRDDLVVLAQFGIPKYRRHQGLNGLIHFLGLLVLCWYSASGAVIYFFIEPGGCIPIRALAIQEAHEKGYLLIPIYLGLHLGGVILHALNGKHLWKEIFFLKTVPKILQRSSLRKTSNDQ
ncbi:MAG: hypothetical protein D3924_12070 [Candidatus Electrothrix sp. AR4]|nr:hypothetical protein [Candidatus Electrothrix sp. AR4]